MIKLPIKFIILSNKILTAEKILKSFWTIPASHYLYKPYLVRSETVSSKPLILKIVAGINQIDKFYEPIILQDDLNVKNI